MSIHTECRTYIGMYYIHPFLFYLYSRSWPLFCPVNGISPNHLPVIVASDKPRTILSTRAINIIWRWTESTPRRGWRRSHKAGIYSDRSTREIIILTSCAKHLTVESNTIVMLLAFILIIISIPSPPVFYSRLKTFLFFFRTDYMDSADCLLIIRSTSVFLLFSFSVFHFLVVGSVR